MEIGDAWRRLARNYSKASVARGGGWARGEKTLVIKRDKETIDTLTSFYALDGTATTIASIVYKEEILSRLLL